MEGKTGERLSSLLGEPFTGDPDNTASVCVIDAYAIRNVAPFINFSCEPNLESRPSFAASGDARLPRVTFYAKRDIYVGEELGYRRDPSATSSKQRNKTIACRCGAAVCNKGV